MLILTPAELLRTIELHLTKTGQTASEFGRIVSGDSSLVLELRRGRNPSLALANRICRLIEQQQTKEDV
jgi:hypothetical protein